MGVNKLLYLVAYNDDAGCVSQSFQLGQGLLDRPVLVCIASGPPFWLNAYQEGTFLEHVGRFSCSRIH
jgi:hypothetical protein